MARTAALTAAALAATLSLAACGGTHPHGPAAPGPAAAHAAGPAAPAATVRCGLLTCSHGRVGQPCSIAGYPGIVVRESATTLTCDPSPGPMPTAPAAPPPAPVSTAASLASNCVMGYELNTGPDQDASGVFLTGPLPAGDVNGDGSVPDPVLAYQVTLTNNSGATASVTGFAVVFYTGGVEDGSDQQGTNGFITPGQSLAWTVIEDQTVHGYGDDSNQEWMQTGAIPTGADSCQLVQWYHS